MITPFFNHNCITIVESSAVAYRPSIFENPASKAVLSVFTLLRADADSVRVYLCLRRRCLLSLLALDMRQRTVWCSR